MMESDLTAASPRDPSQARLTSRPRAQHMGGGGHPPVPLPPAPRPRSRPSPVGSVTPGLSGLPAGARGSEHGSPPQKW